MEWRQQSSVSCELAFQEAQRWMEDNVTVFLKACEKLGLNEAQLFHPGDLQDVSTRVTVRREETIRRLKNVLITIYWLGRKAQSDPCYTGPQLNLKAFEGLLGIALSKALEESGQSRWSVRDSGFVEGWFPDQQSGYSRGDSVESVESMESRTLGTASYSALQAPSEEADLCLRMAEGSKRDVPAREKAHVPSVLRRKRQEYQQSGGSYAAHLTSDSGGGLCHDLPPASAFLQLASNYQSDSETDSDMERPEPDLEQDDLASRRFRSVSSVKPMNFAVPSKPRSSRVPTVVTPCAMKSWLTLSDASRQDAVAAPSKSSGHFENGLTGCQSAAMEEEFLQRFLISGTSDSDEDKGFADPVVDDLYTRRVLISEHQTSINAQSDKFLPKYWTPEEDAHVKNIRLGSQRRPWYKKMQGLRSKSMGDIPLEPIPQEADNCSSFESLGSCSVQQRSVEEMTLDPLTLQMVQREQFLSMRNRIKESEAKWHEDLNKWKTRRRIATSDLQRKLEEQELIEQASSAAGIAQVTDLPVESFGMPGPMSEPDSSVSSGAWSTLALTLNNGPQGVKEESPVLSQKLIREVSDTEQKKQIPLDPETKPDFSCRPASLESFYAGRVRISATLPRGFRRSEGCSRLSTGVTPRPFGAKPSKVSSLPRAYSMDDSHKSLVSGHRERSLVPSFLCGQGKVTDPSDTGHFRSSTPTMSPEKESRDGRSSAPPLSSFSGKVFTDTSVTQKSSDVKVGQSEMRVCLNQKPNSGRDFGFKAHWDSTGACVQSVQAGSPAEFCGLLKGDEIVALGGCRVNEMNYEQFKSSMNAAQQKGNLLMDIRRHGQNGHPENYFPICTNSNSSIETEGKVQLNGQPANLQVPSISSSTSSWSWDHEEERRRQEKWQMEQERLLQEKYRRDQEKLDEEWRRAQQEVCGEHYCDLEEQKSPDVLSNRTPASHIPPPFLNQLNVAFSQKVRAAESRQTAAGLQSQKAHAECDSSTNTQCSEDSYGFAKLTISDRTKSKSSPALQGSQKQDSRASGKKRSQPSQAEMERLQILEEMRKKTQLLTDNSWIRQRTIGTFRSGHRSSLGPGSAIFSNTPKQDLNDSVTLESHPNSQQRSRLVSGRRLCCRCQQPLGKGAAMLIDSLELCFHIACFKCVRCRAELGRGFESGAQSVPPSPIEPNALQQIEEELITETSSGTTPT
ncbi:hypothetical protein DNTS_011130 [Danionella cerebrum]|uniref:PDZ domain-containing protein n=1 Tax=Danionella cerebrum TaxID=2873325 RepID=A0A553MMG9_9TELE|nr:hypothetical protein DNTS_011130 [Danionella translucida]